MTKFPANFPVSRESVPETGSTSTGMSATQSNYFGPSGDFAEKVPTFRALPRTDSVSSAYYFPFSGRKARVSSASLSSIFSNFRFLHPEVDQSLVCHLT